MLIESKLPMSQKSRRGFTLIEVLIALLIISFGLLGVAGMQALSVGNTAVAEQRSIAALQASSIAAAMSANEGYWQTPSAPGTVTVIGSTLSGGMSTSSTDCTAGICSSPQMAAYDVQTWGKTLKAILPNGYGTINCVQPSNAPVTCQIYIYWSEKAYAQNQASGASSTASSQYDFEMEVQP